MHQTMTLDKFGAFAEAFIHLPRKHQRTLLTSLGKLVKPETASLRIKANQSEFLKVFRYCDKYQIKYEMKRLRHHIRFTFKDKTTRNIVLIGMRTLKD